jgi:hypothetical protein
MKVLLLLSIPPFHPPLSSFALAILADLISAADPHQHDASRYEKINIRSLRAHWVWFYKGAWNPASHGYATALPHSYSDIVSSYAPTAAELQKPLPFYRRLFTQPLDDICEYFGLELGFYFAWVGYYGYVIRHDLLLSMCCYMGT